MLALQIARMSAAEARRLLAVDARAIVKKVDGMKSPPPYAVQLADCARTCLPELEAEREYDPTAELPAYFLGGDVAALLLTKANMPMTVLVVSGELRQVRS